MITIDDDADDEDDDTDDERYMNDDEYYLVSRNSFPRVISLYPAVFLPRYEQINRRGRRRGRVLWSPIGGQPTLIHYYRGYGRRFWVVISSNPGNGVVYLVAIFTRSEHRHGGPSVHYFYAIVVSLVSLPRDLVYAPYVFRSSPMKIISTKLRVERNAVHVAA